MKKQIKKIIIGIVVITLIILIWQFTVEYFDIPKRIIPKPTDLWDFIQKYVPVIFIHSGPVERGGVVSGLMESRCV